MPIVMALLWGAQTPLFMWVVYRYWVPKLRVHAGQSAEHYEEEVLSLGVPGHRVLRPPFVKMIAGMVFASMLAFVCGYRAASMAVSSEGLFRMWAAFAVYTCITVTDLKCMVIPNECSLLLLGAGAAALVFRWIGTGVFPVSELVGYGTALIVGLVLLLIMAAVTKGGMGMGDVKIVSSLGFLFGLRSICYVLTIGVVLSALVSTLLLALKKKKMKDLLPLGPFLWGGLGISIFLGVL